MLLVKCTGCTSCMQGPMFQISSLWRYSALGFLGGLAAAALLWTARAAPPQPDPLTFEDVAPRSGAVFVLQTSAPPARRQIEPMVSGVALLDYTGDGKPDIYFVNGARQPQ